MLRTTSPVGAVARADRDEAIALCAQHPLENVFVANKIRQGSLHSTPGALWGYRVDGRLESLLWTGSNLVPVELTVEASDAFAERIITTRRHCASIFGPRDAVGDLWRRIGGAWGPARSLRSHQPLMASSTRPLQAGIPIDPFVRFATPDETDAVLPAAAHMFTEEIGYPPYYGSPRGYRQGVAALIAARHTVVRVECGEVVFKADVGSTAYGVAQVQGVWLHPDLRGRGMAAPAMAAATQLFMTEVAPTLSLYVNDFNIAARATYLRCGFREVGSFATVLM